MQNDLKTISYIISEMGKKIDDMHRIIVGDENSDGLKTTTRLNSASIKRLWCAVLVVITFVAAGVGKVFWG